MMAIVVPRYDYISKYMLELGWLPGRGPADLRLWQV